MDNLLQNHELQLSGFADYVKDGLCKFLIWNRLSKNHHL